MVQLPFAEQLYVVRVERRSIPRRGKIRQAPSATDFITVESPGIALDRFAQGADLGLLRAAALARALAAQAAPQRAQVLNSQGKIAAGPMYVQPRVRAGACA